MKRDLFKRKHRYAHARTFTLHIRTHTNPHTHIPNIREKDLYIRQEMALSSHVSFHINRSLFTYVGLFSHI